MTATHHIHEPPVVLIAGKGILLLTGAIILLAIGACIERLTR